MRLLRRQQDAAQEFSSAFGMVKPAAQGVMLCVWIQDEWSTSEKAVAVVRAEGTDNPLVFVLLPRQQPEALANALARGRPRPTVLASPPCTAKTPGREESSPCSGDPQNSAQGAEWTTSWLIS